MASITSALHVRVVLWAPVAARLLLAFALFESRHSGSIAVIDPVALTALGWSVISFALLLLGQLIQRRNFVWHFSVDLVIAMVAAMLHPEALLPAAILLFCSAQPLVRAGLPSAVAIASALPFLIAPFAANAQNISISELFGPAGGRIVGYAIICVSLLVGTAAAALSAARGDQLRQFDMHALSLRMLKLDRSLEFDLQRLIELLATLFPDRNAYCLISGNAEQATTRSFSLDGLLELDASERARLLDYREKATDVGMVIDNGRSALVDFDGRIVGAFDDADRRIAFLLAKNGLNRTLAKPFNIGRAKGMMLIAVPQLDAIILHEARLICTTLDALFPTLDSIAEAERNFIADAHDVARRDLHDGVLQTLAAVRMRLLSIGRQRDMKDHPAQASVEKVADILTLEQARLRGLLEASEDEDHGVNLVTRLDVGLRTISMQWDIDAKLESEEPAIPIDKESAINIEHLVREAVANAVRHADSSQLTVRLSLTQDSLRIAIVDRNEGALKQGAKKGGKSMPLRSASLLHRLRLVNGSAYADGLENRAILAITIPMQRIDRA